MSSRRILIRHSGYWERSDYIGGDEVLVYMHVGQLSYDNLLREIQDQVDNNGSADFLVHYTTSMSNGRKTKVSLKNDTDFFRLLAEQIDYPIVYVMKKDKQLGGGVAYQNDSQRSTVLVGEDNVNECEPADDKKVSSDEEDCEVAVDEQVSSDEEDNRRKELFKSLAHEFEGWIRQPEQLDRIVGHRNFSSEHEEGGSGNHTDDFDVNPLQHTLRNWMVVIPDFGSILPLGWDEPLFPERGQLCLNATFRSKNELAIAVGLYHMENKVEYRSERSNTTRVGFVCKHSNKCLFKIRAIQSVGVWRIVKFVPDHTCQSDLSRTAGRQVPAKVVATYFARKMSIEGVVLKPKEMKDEMLRLYGIEISYKFAQRSKNIAIEMIYGGFEESYQRLPSYLYLLKERNPGTIYDIQTNHKGEFLYMFLALGPSINAFQHHLRPVIVIDGTHLKGKNKGILFIAVTKDGNEGIFPLAVGLGPIENDESWTFFLSKLRMSLGDPQDDLLIVSDQHKSIQNAVESVYPNVAHGLCFYHIQKNLTRYGRHVAAIFKNAAYSYKHEMFEANFSTLKELNPIGAYKQLSEIGIERWAKSKCPVRRYSFMTSNAAEIMNAPLRWARRLQVCSMIEVYRSIVEKWFDTRRASALARDHELTEEAFTKLSASVEWGRRYTVRGTTTHLFKVEADNKTNLVDLMSWTCECREFELDMMPCRHACAAIRHVNNNVYDFVHSHYKQRALVQTYGPIIEPVPEPDSWHMPTYVSRYIIRPPVIEKQAGRPKEQRYPTPVENISTARQKCSRCNGEGHNKRACKTPINTEEPTIQKRRQKKKCSICRSEEHTKNRCQMNFSE